MAFDNCIEAIAAASGLDHEAAARVLNEVYNLYERHDAAGVPRPLRRAGHDLIQKAKAEIGQPIPAGHPLERPQIAAGAEPLTGIPEVDRVLADPYVAGAIANPKINRENDVPYGAGPNNANDGVTNVDRHVPKEAEVDGVKYDPAIPVVVHEQVEKHVFNLLTAAGLSDDRAYPIAHFGWAEPAEEAWVAKNIGPNAWQGYQDNWAKWLKPIDHENPKNPPPDLYQKPYPHDDDHLASRDKGGSFSSFEKEGEAKANKLRIEGEAALAAHRGSPAEGVVRQALHHATVAASQSPEPLDQRIGQVLETEGPPAIEAMFPKGAQAAPPPPAQAPPTAPQPEPLFDDATRGPDDLFNKVPMEDGSYVTRQEFLNRAGRGRVLAKLIGECEV
jgi:hypothetical protein